MNINIPGINQDLIDLVSIESDSENWTELLPRVKLQADQIHHIKDEVIDIGPVTHVRVNIFLDGGLSRIRIMAEVC